MTDYLEKRNEQGKTLSEFLATYDADKYKHPSTTVDMVVATVQDKALKILLVKRRDHPFIGCWATPGGFIQFGEDIDAAAMRELYEETGLREGIYFRQLYTFGKADRDPRTHVITTAYITLAPETVIRQSKAGDDAVDTEWFTVKHQIINEGDYERTTRLTLESTKDTMVYYISERVIDNWVKVYSQFSAAESTNQLAGDHIKIINMAINEIQEHALSGGLIFNMLPEEFTLNALRQAYEAITGVEIASSRKPNFNRDIQRYVLPTGHTEKSAKTRRRETALYKPNRLYKHTDF